jgi:hypothetical protein
MGEEERNSTGAPADPPAAEKLEPRSYYYDDATGYEVYDPAAEEDELEEPRDTSD